MPDHTVGSPSPDSSGEPPIASEPSGTESSDDQTMPGTVHASAATRPTVQPGSDRTLATRIRTLRAVPALAVGAAAGAALVGLAWTLTAVDLGNPGTFSTTGGIFLADSDGFVSDGKKCMGKGGYEDLRAGTEVTVTDASGSVVAADSLALGKVVGETCMFKFTVHDIPVGSKLFRIEVSHRGAITKTEAELRLGDIGLTLGG
ncbi:hypothetical protein OHA33_34035 [Streptomyces sp. NBC_00562]|uniref:hypothetical protein n=1 Tax=Streptomyces sp. NBC_00562 TaxID=2975777 RepID=UPI002E817514|nr:hypothetical protein [Streptomyces sp. NBC_00562]WUC23478.1 hypothetical protein OHA33_34035 [Streptomyces sp. NBC_00562]